MRKRSSSIRSRTLTLLRSLENLFLKVTSNSIVFAGWPAVERGLAASSFVGAWSAG
jgi:hypothetical protein